MDLFGLTSLLLYNSPFSIFNFTLLCIYYSRRSRGQDAARDRPLNLLFQVIKRSKTRGDVKMTLRVGPTSLDRVDGERLQHRVSSLPLLSVEKVYLFTDDATQVCWGWLHVRCVPAEFSFLPNFWVCFRAVRERVYCRSLRFLVGSATLSRAFPLLVQPLSCALVFIKSKLSIVF